MNNSRYFTAPGSDRTYDRNWMLVALLISLALTLLQVSSVNNLLPAIGNAMVSSESGIQLILSGFALAVGITLVPAGRLGDLFGRSSLWVIGLAVFTIGCLGCGLAGSITQLNLMRVLQGIGGGLFSPQVTGLILQYFQGKARARAFGYMGLVISASVAAGPVISGALVALLGSDPGWRYSFFLNVPIGALGLVAAWKFLPFTKERQSVQHHVPARPRERIDLDPVGMALLAFAVLGIMLPFMLHGVAWRWILLLAGFALLGGWIAWELWYAKRGNAPMVNMELFRLRSFSYCTAITAIQFLGSSTIFVVIALFLQNGLGVSALMVGLIGLPNAIMSGFAAVWSGRHSMERGKAIQAGALAMMLASVLLIIAGFWCVIRLEWSIYWLILPIIPMGLGAGSLGAANQTQSMMDVPTAHGGTAGGLQQMTQRITTAVGNALITGVLFSTYGGGTTPEGWLRGASIGLGTIAVFLSCALALAVIFWKRVPPQRSRPAAA